MKISVRQLRAIIREELQLHKETQQINEIFGLFENPVVFSLKSDITFMSRKLAARAKNAEEFFGSFRSVFKDEVESATGGYFKNAELKPRSEKSVIYTVEVPVGNTGDKKTKKPEDIKAAIETAKKVLEDKLTAISKHFESGTFDRQTDIKDWETAISEPKVVWSDPKTKKEIPPPKKFASL